MTLSSMVVSRDLQEVSVLECILGGLHIGVDVESEPERARIKLAKSKIDALIIDFDLVRGIRLPERIAGWRHPQRGAAHHRQRLRRPEAPRVPRAHRSYFEKPISVEQAVHTLSAARNMILDERLRYHRADSGCSRIAYVREQKTPDGTPHESQPGWHRRAFAASS